MTDIASYGVDSPTPWTGAASVGPKNVGQGVFTMVDIMVTSPLYLCSADRNVVWGGNLYQAFPFTVSGIRNNTQMAPEPLRIGISNCARTFLSRLSASAIQGKNMVFRRAHWETGTIFSSPFILFSGWVDTVQIKEDRDQGAVFLEVKNEFLRWDATAPRNSFSAACNWAFKSTTPGCQYTGTATVCDRSWDQCKGLLNTPRFRGFRVIPLIEDREFWWGRSKRW
jgi:hypothetical protein